MFRKFFWMAFSLLFPTSLASGQSYADFTKNPWFWGVSAHPWGYIVPHSSELEAVDLNMPLGLQLEGGWHLNGQKTWDQCRCYPRAGFSLLVFDYQNPEELGQSINFTGFIEPFVSFRSNWQASFRLGAGLSYLTQVYDSLTNPNNLFYSSPLSFMLRTQLNVHYRFSPKWEARLSGHFQHISNGGISKPNKGMNFPSVSLGVLYAPSSIELPLREYAQPLDSLYASRWQHRVFLAAGMKEIDDNNEKKYPAFGGTYYITRIVSRNSGFHLGASYLWDGSMRIRRQQREEAVNSHSISVLGGHEFLMGRFIFSQALGVYLHKPSSEHDTMYHRWGLYYRANQRVLVGFNLKAHRHIADILDFRLGYTW